MNSRPFCRSPSPSSSSQMKIISSLNSNDHVYSDSHPRQDSYTAPPSISSIMSSMPSLQPFMSFIPLSWSNSRRPSPAPAALPLSHSTSSSVSEATVVPDVVSSRKGGYVSRKKQLQLLKAQMEMEGVGTMRAPVQCKKCDRELVFI